MVEILKASLLTFFSKKVREKGVCGKLPGPYSAAKVKPAVTTVGGGVLDAPHSSTHPVR